MEISDKNATIKKHILDQKEMPLFPNKIKSTAYITLEENGEIISIGREIARIFDKFLVNIVPNLRVNTNHKFLKNVKYSP